MISLNYSFCQSIFFNSSKIVLFFSTNIVGTDYHSFIWASSLVMHILWFIGIVYIYEMLLCCRMDRVIACILVLIAAFIIQYLWQYYRTMTDEDGVAIAVDVAEPVTHRDEPQVLSLQVLSASGLHVYVK